MSETFEIKPEYKRKDIRSFVIRGGRMTLGQKNAFDKQWSVYGLSLFDGALDLAQAYGRQAPVVLEIGFGMGDSLLEMAKQESDKNFLGIEVHPPGVGRLINNAGKDELKNLRVYMADATDVLEDCIADESIDRFQLYFPDPWHKKKHHKRRIVQLEFVQRIRKKLKVGGRVPYGHRLGKLRRTYDGSYVSGRRLFQRRRRVPLCGAPRLPTDHQVRAPWRALGTRRLGSAVRTHRITQMPYPRHCKKPQHCFFILPGLQ